MLCAAAAGGVWTAADIAGAAAVPLSEADAPAPPEDELPVSAESVLAEVEAGAAADDEPVALELPVASSAGAEPPVLAPESVDGVAAPPDDVGADADVESVGSGVDVADVPGPGESGVVAGDVAAGAVGSLAACGDDALVRPLGAGLDDGVAPPPEAEPVPVEAAVDVEVAPLDVVGVEEAVDEPASPEVGVAVAGARAGARSGPASGPLDRPAARAGTEASSVSRAVGGAVTR